MNEYLYHYTSIQTLALILKSKKIRFNNLMNVADPEEAETKDLGLFGKHCLVSCWTKCNEDILPMWNMYTPDMKGVRIRMRLNPFKTYEYEKGEMYFSEKTLSYIDYKSNYVKKVSIVAKCPVATEVNYTEKEELLHPRIIDKTKNGISVSFENVGRHKRKCWSFQQEYRYIITTAPWSIEELEKVKSPEEQMQLFNRLFDRSNTQFCEEIYLDLADDAFQNMEILLAPKAGEAEYTIVQALVDKYCTGVHVNLNKSQIRVR